jgi:sugar/nucleoside kinase (ribokinase family)
MSLLVIGTVAFDTIETPYARRERVIGGSATYFAAASTYFGGVSLVAVVGEDFPEATLEHLRALGIDTRGVEVAPGKSFFWSGRYEADWNTRHTLTTELNVLESFDPKIPAELVDSPYVFLANAAPSVQLKALEQCTAPKLVVADTMNLWIDIARPELDELLTKVDGLVLNDEEAKMLSGETNLIRAARKVLAMGPRFVILKKGEHGAFVIGGEDLHFSIPAYPVDEVVDPTGAGDSFAGGFMGYVAAEDKTDDATLRQAMLYGTVTASFAVQGFSDDVLVKNERSALQERIQELRSIVTL